MSILAALRSPLHSLKRIFHWKYASVLVFFFLGLAFTMAGIGSAIEPFEEVFDFAVLLLVLSVIWAIGWWLSSDNLEKKRPRPTKKQIKRKEKVSLAAYRGWQLIPVILMFLAFLCLVKLTRKIELARELSLNHGWLTPGDDRDPPDPCTGPFTPPDALRIHLGNMMAYGTLFPYPILAVDGKKELFVNRDEKGRVAISLDIRSADGKIIAAIENGHFVVNANNSLDIQHPDRSTLIIRDEYKNEVLNVRYKNKTHLELAALLQYPNGKAVRISKDVPPTNCIGNFGGTAINVTTH